MFIQEQAETLNIKTPVITFDQPLWYKASGVIAEKDLKIVYRLGGFHTLMSFIGSIGYMMSGSGLEEALGQVYAENTVPHMMSGKAYARAVRGYTLLDSALNNILIKEVIPTPDDDAETDRKTLSETDLDVIEKACNTLSEEGDIGRRNSSKWKTEQHGCGSSLWSMLIS